MMRNLPAALLMLLLSTGASAAPIELGRPFKDESNGFKLKIPAKWEQVPTKFQEVAIIGKWNGKAKRGRVDPECDVLRFLRQGGGGTPEPAIPSGEAPRGIPGYENLLRGQPKDLWTYLEQTGQRWKITPEPDFKVLDKTLRVEFRVYRQELPSGYGGREADAVQTVLLAAQIEQSENAGAIYGVLYGCSVADLESMEVAFRNSIRSFRLLELDEEDVSEDGEENTDAGIFVDSETKPDEWRAARRKKLIPGWEAVDTKNYLVVYNKEVKKQLVTTIAKHIEAIREQIYQKLFPPARDVKAISVVRVCKDVQEYFRYGGPGGSAGYWSRGDEELVFYQDKSNEKDSLRVLYHEAFHQYIHYAVGDVSPHSWFNEGHGDYFAGFNYKQGKFISDVFRWRTGIISDAISTKSYVPLDQFLKYTQGQYYSNAGLCYAQGWSFVYFLREVEARKLKKYQKYWGLLDRYFNAIKANVATVKEKGLEGLDPAPPDPSSQQPVPEPMPGEETPVGTDPARQEAPVPGLEGSFPGEHAAAGAPAAPESPAGGGGETVTVAGPKLRTMDDALDLAVDHAFKGIDLSQLEKDWIEFSK